MVDYPYLTVSANTPNTSPNVTLKISDGGEIDEAELAQVVKDYLATLPGATNIVASKFDVTSNPV